MSQIWKDFRTNLMYWRFRHVTRNRLRVQTWYSRRRGAAPVPNRSRGTATYVYRRSSRRSWLLLAVMVAVLTGLRVLPRYVAISPWWIGLLSAVVVVGTVYWALREV